MCREESQKRIVIRAMEVRLWILWVWQDVIHIEVLERDAFRFDSLKIKRAQNRFIVSFRVDDEMVDGFDASVFCDGIQRATRDGDGFKLEIGIPLLEVELVDVAVGRGGHLVQKERMGVKIIVFARCYHVNRSISVAHGDVQKFYLVRADALSVVVFQDIV